jgi:hypothetical protein
MKHQYQIGTRILNFDGDRKESEQKAIEWQQAHPQHTGVKHIKRLTYKKK